MHTCTFHDSTLNGACYVTQEMKTEKHDQYGAYNLQWKWMKAMETEVISLGLWKNLFVKESFYAKPIFTAWMSLCSYFNFGPHFNCFNSFSQY